MPDSHNKPIIEQTGSDHSLTEPKFDKQAFEDAVYNQGYDVLLEKAIKCPCRIKANDNSLSDCKNCGGKGWIFINKRATRMVVQSMNRATKFKNWTEEDRGTVSITARDDDKLAFMDRITNLDLESSYNEVVKFKLYNDKLMGAFIYEPNQFEFAHLFLKSSKKLKPLKKDVDFTVNGYVVTLNEALKKEQVLDNEFSVSFRYYHNPQYHIIDIPRERVANRDAKDSVDYCHPSVQFDTRGNESGLPQLPVNAMGRKTHYIFDKPDLDGVGLIDNSTEPIDFEEISNCDIINSRISEGDRLSCVLPTFDFTKASHYAALSTKQKLDIGTKLGSTKIIAIPFTTNNLSEIAIIVTETVGTYTTASLFGNITGVSFEVDRNDLNGFQAIVFPFTVALAHKLKVIIVRTSPDPEDLVIIKGS